MLYKTTIKIKIKRLEVKFINFNGGPSLPNVTESTRVNDSLDELRRSRNSVGAYTDRNVGDHYFSCRLTADCGGVGGRKVCGVVGLTELFGAHQTLR